MSDNEKKGELRRSEYVNELYHQLGLEYDLVVLLNDFESGKLKLNDEELKKDCKTTIELIEQIESYRDKERYNMPYRSFVQDHIIRLGEIMAKAHIRLKVDFSEYLESTKKIRHEKGKEHPILVGDHLEKINNLYDKKRLRKLKFVPYFPDSRLKDGLIHPNNYQKDEGYRILLTLGLFHYLQKVLLGKRGRPRRCVQCNELYYAKNVNSITCSPYCKEKNYYNSPDGHWKRKENMKKYRLKKKNPPQT